MKLSRFEKLGYLGIPWFFGVVYILVGLVRRPSDPVVKIITNGFGLLFISLFLVCCLLVKLIEKD